MLAGVAGVFVGASLVMALAWLIGERTGQSGWADAIWSLCVGMLGVAAALLPLADEPAPSPRQWLVAAMAAAWSARLAVHIALRTHGRAEDPRYAELRREWGGEARWRLFWFFQIQAVVAAVLALSIALAARNPAPGLRLLDWLGLAVIAAAIVGEAVADRQLQRFRTRSRSFGAVCEVGLWRFSRHPNYFFEWLVWVAYPLIAFDPGGGYGWGWLALSAPVLMYWLLVHVSGIPPLEAHMLRTRGDAFRAYQARVNAFWPGAAGTPPPGEAHR